MNQTLRILQHLLSGKSITPIQALEKFGCFRLGARIYDIKQRGYEVETELVSVGDKTFANYSIRTRSAA